MNVYERVMNLDNTRLAATPFEVVSPTMARFESGHLYTEFSVKVPTNPVYATLLASITSFPR